MTELQEVYTMKTEDSLGSMGNEDQIRILRQGAVAWNEWIRENPDEHLDLYETNLSGADLSKANLRGANLFEASLSKANLIHANLSEASLSKANLRGAILHLAILISADLSKANLRGAILHLAILISADLSGANLSGANLSEANFEKATLTGCNIYAISAWEVELEGAMQNDMVITRPNQPVITVDNLEVAQFIYLLIHNEKIRKVIDTITSKVVLILGRFTDTRKPVLDAIRDELRNRDTCQFFSISTNQQIVI